MMTRNSFNERSSTPAGIITPILRSLHWLPVRRKIVFKTAVRVWKCIQVVAAGCRCVTLQHRASRWKMSEVVLGYGCSSWMYRAAKSADINRTARFHILRAHSMEQSPVWSARQRRVTRSVVGWKLIFSDGVERHLAPSGDSGAVYIIMSGLFTTFSLSTDFHVRYMSSPVRMSVVCL